MNMEADWVDEENEDEVRRAVVCVKPARWYQRYLICILTGCPVEGMGRIQQWRI